MEKVANQLMAFVTMYGLKIIGAIIILIIGHIADGIGRKIVTKTLKKSKTDPAVISFI